jgi:peptidoglycan/xylan/chitin deacetylase (PgdA/CDA1 family)
MKSSIRQTIAWMYYKTKHFLRHLQGKALILTYHRVLSEKELNQYFIQPGMYVCNDVFEKQMQFLQKHFQILSFAELLSLWKDKALDQNKRYCVITFDDGWLDNYIYAYPILKNYRIPATIFLTTSFIGTNHWFWSDQLIYLLQRLNDSALNVLLDSNNWLKDILRPHHLSINEMRFNTIIEKCKQRPDDEIQALIEKIKTISALEFPEERMFLNWQEVNEMSHCGISFGSHSCTHKILTKLSVDEIQKEIEDSLCTLREKKINYIPIFCYPNGNYTQEIIKLVKAAGYQGAVSANFGFEDGFPQNLFALKRISIHNDISSTIPLFSWRISSLY